MSDDISLRSIQHFLYCPHRWGLLEIDRAWAENYYVARANLLHQHVHSGGIYSNRGRKVYTAVTVWDDRYDIYGVADCIEISGEEYTVVEYKPTAPKDAVFREDDILQVFAQKVCVDTIFKTNSQGIIYHGDTRKRIVLPFDSEYNKYLERLESVLYEMRRLRANGIIPSVRRDRYCGGCSMKDMCMPKVFGKGPKMQKSILNFAMGDI